MKILPIFSLGAPLAVALSWIEFFSTQTHVVHVFLPLFLRFLFCYFLFLSTPSTVLAYFHTFSVSLSLSLSFSFAFWLSCRYTLQVTPSVSLDLCISTEVRGWRVSHMVGACRPLNTILRRRRQPRDHRDRVDTVLELELVSRETRTSRKNTKEVTAASAGTGHPC